MVATFLEDNELIMLIGTGSPNFSVLKDKCGMFHVGRHPILYWKDGMKTCKDFILGSPITDKLMFQMFHVGCQPHNGRSV